MLNECRTLAPLQALVEAKLELVFDLLHAENRLLVERQDQHDEEIRRLRKEVARLQLLVAQLPHR